MGKFLIGVAIVAVLVLAVIFSQAIFGSMDAQVARTNNTTNATLTGTFTIGNSINIIWFGVIIIVILFMVVFALKRRGRP